MSRRLTLCGICATALALGLGARGSAAEPRLRGGKAVLKVAGDASRYHLVQPGTAVSFTVTGPGTLQLRARSMQNANGDGPVGTLHVSVDGSEVAALGIVPGLSHFAGRRDLTTGAATDREVKIGEGQRIVVLSAESGPVAVAVDWVLDALNLLTAAPLVADKPVQTEAPLGQGEARDSSLHRAPTPEVAVPLTIEASSPPRRAPWPLVFAGGALITGIAGAVVWGVAASTDGSYNSTPEGPGRDGKLSAANNELHASMALAAVAIVLGATATIGLMLQ